MDVSNSDSESDTASGNADLDYSEVNSDISTFLRLLLRSGRIHYLAAVGEDEEEEAEDEELEEDIEDYSNAEDSSSSTTRNSQPDTSGVDLNDIKEVLMNDSGCFASPSVRNISPNIFPRVTHLRETGSFSRRGNLSSHHMASINQSFLPNHSDIIQKYHRKVFCGTYSRDGNIFLSACQDEHIRIYDTTKNAGFDLFKDIQAHDVGWSILDTAFSPDGLFLIYSSWSECIHLCNIYGDSDIHIPLNLRPDCHRSFCVFSLMFSMDNKEIVGGANQGDLYVFDRERNERTLKVNAHDDDTNAVCFADNSSHILYSGSDDGLVKVWDRRTLQEHSPVPVGIFSGHRDGITFIDSKEDGRFLISNCKDQTIKLWDIRKFSTEEGVNATRRAVAKQDWDYRWQAKPCRMDKSKLKDDSSVMTYTGHSVLNTLMRARFSPVHSTGQRYIYTGSSRGHVLILDVLTGEILLDRKIHKNCVRDVSWHPYLPELVSTSWDGCLGKLSYSGLNIQEMEIKQGIASETDSKVSCAQKKCKTSSRMRLRSQPY